MAYYVTATKPNAMVVLVSSFVLLCLSQVTLVLADGNNSRTTHILEFVSVESKTAAIQVSWNISEDAELGDLIVVHNKIGGEFTTYSSTQFNYTQDFWITDLISNTRYNVCLSMRLEDATKSCPPSACQLCVDMATIPLIRDDSLIAVIVTVGMILLLIIIGCLCWHYAKKKQQEEEEEEDDSDSLIASDESKQPILLAVPPTSNGPRRSVDFEDQDIPYITPPIDELKREQNNKRQEFFSQV